MSTLPWGELDWAASASLRSMYTRRRRWGAGTGLPPRAVPVLSGTAALWDCAGGQWAHWRGGDRQGRLLGRAQLRTLAVLRWILLKETKGFREKVPLEFVRCSSDISPAVLGNELCFITPCVCSSLGPCWAAPRGRYGLLQTCTGSP